ncbi:MAG: bifunctional folylpolyglutamate synthase/dihydrofolate synthase [Planctomycetota bacterium]|jgi:dihydrofolate synthase/folylpolyglutamate synthase
MLPDISSHDTPHGTSAGEEAARRFLFGRIDYERALKIPYHQQTFKLDRMRELVNRLGCPHRAFPVVHVAGTKGKGSTAAMLGAVLSAAGYRTGLFTSPHLNRVEERIAVDGRACSATDLVGLVDRLSPVVQSMDRAAAVLSPPESGPTYFEVVTAAALLHFAEQRVDTAVMEVGLGGRLDSTNVCRPAVSIITSISLDHTAQLGNTLESIASEKAGIVKPGVPVVSGVQQAGPREVIRRVCREQGCRIAELGHDFHFEYRPPARLESATATGTMDFRYHGPDREQHLRDVSLRLLGRHQASNAAVALAALAELGGQGWQIPDTAVRTALAGLNWPARVELMARRPAIVVDSAHNRASIAAMIRVLDESFHVRRRVLVFATSLDKDVDGMLSQVLGRFDHVVFTRYLNNPRAVPPQRLARAAERLSGQRHEVFRDPAAAWDRARQLASPDDLVCVAGSFFIAAELRERIRASTVGAESSSAYTTNGY